MPGPADILPHPSPEPEGWRLMRQPYRVTMARWPFTIYQKRVLTGIIAQLQDEIRDVEKGIPPGRLDRFRTPDRSICLAIPYGGLVRHANNHHRIREALHQLATGEAPIRLPAVKGRKGLAVGEETILRLIDRVEITRYRRDLRLWVPKEVAEELIRPGNGWTLLSQRVLLALEQTHTLRLYELLSHWKDKEVFAMPLEKFRSQFGLEDRYAETKELMRSVIGPAAKKLAALSDLQFHCEPARSGRCITHLRFVIRHRKSQEQEDQLVMRLREQVTNILRIRFGFRQEEFARIQPLLQEADQVRKINERVGYLWQYLSEHPGEVNHPKGWALSALLNPRALLAATG